MSALFFRRGQGLIALKCLIVGQRSAKSFEQEIGQKDLFRSDHPGLEERHLGNDPIADVGPACPGDLLPECVAMRDGTTCLAQGCDEEWFYCIQTCREAKTRQLSIKLQAERDPDRHSLLLIAEFDFSCAMRDQGPLNDA